MPKFTEQYLLKLLEQYSDMAISQAAIRSLSGIEIATLILAACDHRQKECAYYLELTYHTLNKYQTLLRKKLGTRTMVGCLQKTIKLRYFQYNSIS